MTDVRYDPCAFAVYLCVRAMRFLRPATTHTAAFEFNYRQTLHNEHVFNTHSKKNGSGTRA